MPDARRTESFTLSLLAFARVNARATHSGGLPFVSSGRQRLHGLKPANIASWTLEKYFTFCGSGLLAGHDGRQKIPVVCTPRKKTPSYDGSFFIYARCISLTGGML